MYLLLSLREETEPKDLLVKNEKIKPIWIKFFLFKRSQAIQHFLYNVPLNSELLVTYQVILNRLGNLDACQFIAMNENKLLEDENAKEFKSAFAFVRLQQKGLEHASFNEMQDYYLESIQNMNLLKKFFYDMEIFSTFSAYFHAYYESSKPAFVENYQWIQNSEFVLWKKTDF